MGPACYQLKPCKSYEVCEDTFTTTLYTCKCQDGFNGTECENYLGMLFIIFSEYLHGPTRLYAK